MNARCSLAAGNFPEASATLNLTFTFTCLRSYNISPAKCEILQSIWPLHLYLPPVCAQDAAYGRLNGSREASHAMCLEHQPSTVASKRRKIHLRIGTGPSPHRRLDHLLGRGEVDKVIADLLPAKEDQAIKGRQERNGEEATGLMIERAAAMHGRAAMPLTGVTGPREIAIEVPLTLLTRPPDPRETEIDHLLAFPTGVAGLAMRIPKGILISRKSQDLTTKASGHTAITQGSSRRVPDLNVLETSLPLEINPRSETDLRSKASLLSETGLRLEESLRLEISLHLETNLRSGETSPHLETSLHLGETGLHLALGVHQREKRTPLMLSTGALALRVMETEAPRSTEAIVLREMDSAVPPALSAEVRALRATERGTHPTEAPGRLIVTASSMTMSPSPYHIPAPQANGYTASTQL